MNKLFQLWKILRQTFRQWQTDKASRLAAALSYYTAFSLAPILVIIIAIVGVVYGEQTAQEQVLMQLQELVGPQGTAIIRVMVVSAQDPQSGRLATLGSVVFFVFGATAVFTQLQDALNTIWRVEPKPQYGWLMFLRDRMLSFAMILGVGFVLLGALVLSAMLSGLNQWLAQDAIAILRLGRIAEFLMSYGVITLLFALIYKVLPDALIQWKDVWAGAIMTSILFAFGKTGLGLYLAHTSFNSSYGAAGSFAVLLLWVYYSAQIFFFGAELTQVYARRYGADIRPAAYAVSLDATPKGL